MTGYSETLSTYITECRDTPQNTEMFIVNINEELINTETWTIVTIRETVASTVK
jgi:hypothetical protein